MSGKLFVLLNLDTVKAFDYLGWDFLFRLLERIGFGPLFLQMIKACYASASSSILLQGKLTEPVELRQSVRQGCPLSSLLYWIAANALNTLLTQAADEGHIKGVYIEETSEQATHGQFVDNTNVIIEVKRNYIDYTFGIFKKMGLASELYVKESGVKVVLVPDQPIPLELANLDWCWGEGRLGHQNFRALRRHRYLTPIDGEIGSRDSGSKTT